MQKNLQILNLQYTGFHHISLRADKLAEIARLQEVDISSVSIDYVRDNLLDSSEILISKIQNILISTPPLSFDGPSSDDFSNSDAIRDLSRKRSFRDM